MISLPCFVGIILVAFLYFRRHPEINTSPTPTPKPHTQVFGKKLVLEKQGLMAWTQKKEKGSCRVGGFWRRRKELCVSGTDRRLGFHSFAVAQEWSDLWCDNTRKPGTMFFETMTKFGVRECSYSMDQMGLDNEHLSSIYDKIKTEALSPSFLHCVHPGRGTAWSPLCCPMCPKLDFLLALARKKSMYCLFQIPVRVQNYTDVLINIKSSSTSSWEHAF